MAKYIFILLLGLISFTTLSAQNKSTNDKFYEQYNKNIKKPRINGVYIPKDLNDVYKELNELSSKNAISKFKMGQEKVVAKKLRLGIGRWMFVNWNFYEGSRLSHFLKETYGISHPDDMSYFLIIAYHRHLNNILDTELELAKNIAGDRRKKLIEKHIIKDIEKK